MAPSTTLVARSEAERPGPIRRGLSILHPIDRPDPNLRRQVFNLHSMSGAADRGPQVSSAASEETPGLPFGTAKGYKPCFFSTAPAATFLCTSKEKWGPESRSLRCIPGVRQGANPRRVPGDLPAETGATKKTGHEVAVHKTGFEKQILWQLPDKGC